MVQAVRVVDYDKQVLDAGFKSWFGGILCLDWSPDGRYIVTGGEVGGTPLSVLLSSASVCSGVFLLKGALIVSCCCCCCCATACMMICTSGDAVSVPCGCD